ncbi:unnamed protein product [Vitrella brassicaformis CCMP3155]|uniref:PPM-type phosphatase domain-containing protein n=1 Tax=Vitrella brassicaformis (strain CCMP3155) TaxID=1169540 RepID=A0A0G4G1R0_VITBC|nr:unnamed protein product [Vitrella brassicaformis CCMP3155]|eukprot:CEM21825.1 unnamed protein product [Vitrella brassicaformis CCMP3155]
MHQERTSLSLSTCTGDAWTLYGVDGHHVSAFAHDKVAQHGRHDDSFNTTISGTTAGVALHKANKVFIAHVGDSRAILGIKTNDSESFVAETLTQDHHPRRPDEKERIRAADGLIGRFPGEERISEDSPCHGPLAMCRGARRA